MRFRVPFEYSARVVKKGHRTPEHQFFWEWTEVDVEDLDPLDAPVAVRWNDALPPEIETYREKDEWGTWPEGGVRETRWHDGSHWWEALAPTPLERHGPSARLAPGRLAEMCASGDDYGNPLMRHFNSRGRAMTPEAYPIDPDAYRRVEECSRQSELDAIEAAARSMIAVDGRLYRRGPEPAVWAASWVPSGHSVSAVLKVGPLGSRTMKDPAAAYRADRFDEAEAAMLLDGVEAGLNAARRPEVLLPESLAYDDETSAFLSGASKAAARVSSKAISDFPADVAYAWCVLRDALAGAGPGTDPAEVETALEAYAASGGLSSDHAAEAWRVLERWRSRPISMDEEEAASRRP